MLFKQRVLFFQKRRKKHGRDATKATAGRFSSESGEKHEEAQRQGANTDVVTRARTGGRTRLARRTSDQSGLKAVEDAREARLHKARLARVGGGHRRAQHLDDGEDVVDSIRDGLIMENARVRGGS